MSHAERMSSGNRRVKYITSPGRTYGPSYRLTDAQYRRLVKKAKGTIVRVKVGRRLQAVARTLYQSVPV